MKIVARKLGRFLSGLVDGLTNTLIFSSRADKLLIAAFIVAALRQMGVNGHFIGFDPASQWPWFQPLEVFSGLAMALLEGLALAYVARRWRRLNPSNWREWTYWWTLLTGMIIITIALVVYVAFYGFAAQRGQLVHEIFSPWENMVWNFLVAGVVPLIAVLIGIVADDDVKESTETSALSEQDEALLKLIELIQRNGKLVTAPELANEAGVSLEAAGLAITQAANMGMLNDIT